MSTELSSEVALTARVGGTTFSTAVEVYHDPGEDPGRLVDWAMELAPPMDEWEQVTARVS